MKNHATRVSRSIVALFVIAGMAASLQAGQAGRAASTQRQQAAQQSLTDRFPGIQFQNDAAGAGRLKTIFGVPMHAGNTPQAAVDAFLATDIDTFGVPDIELWQDHVWDISGGDFTIARFHQTIDGIPVENALGRVLVRNFGDGTPGRAASHVVMVTGVFAQKPEGGFAADTVTAEQAVANLRAMEGLPNWSQPEMVIFFGEGEYGTAKRCWKVRGDAPAIGQPIERIYFVDAATGDVVHVRNNIHNIDVTGTAQAFATPGTKPDIAGNTPVLLNVPKLNISITGGSSAYSTSTGAFTIANPGSTPVTITTNASAGRWVNVNPTAGSEISASTSATPGTPTNIVLNTAPSELLTAQANVLIHTTAVHDYFRDRLGAGPIPGIDIQIVANTGVSGTCNAFFSPSAQTINFYNAGGGCSNTAYSTVIVHEYGHFIVDRLGLGQGGFGEGFGDSNAVLMYDVGIVGENFQGTSPVRNIDTANQQYPCTSTAIHTCGQIVAGVWRDIRLNLGTSLGSAAGLNAARNLHVAWAPVTAGGEGSSFLNSANPTTAIEVLTLDDNDGDLSNCTPNYAAITAAFTKHGVPVPKPSLTASFVGDQPSIITPNLPKIVTISSPTSAGTAMALVYRVNGGSYTTLAMTESPSGTFSAALPATACPGTINYYIQRTSGSCAAYLPAAAPTTVYTASVAGSSATPISDTFQSNLGWTVSNTTGLTAGAWARGIPANGNRGDPTADYDGSGQCYVTQNVAGDSDVDGGGTYLISPTFNASGGDAYVSYARWYSNNFGGAPETDTFVVEISNNNGSTWTNLETVGPSGTEVRGGWFYKTFRIADKIAPSSTMKVRFLAQDLGTGSVVEAGVDAFKVDVLTCPPPCAADFNNDGFLDFTDFDAFVAAFEVGAPSGDFNNDGFIDFTDFDAYVAAFEAGC
ncbi:MAG: GC-type dockerin domain-anchored protein [Planctomycetota bacterium]|nr:GC-type dockerin domain-anchored protein [Planctomycetota bacterium]